MQNRFRASIEHKRADINLVSQCYQHKSFTTRRMTRIVLFIRMHVIATTRLYATVPDLINKEMRARCIFITAQYSTILLS